MSSYERYDAQDEQDVGVHPKTPLPDKDVSYDVHGELKTICWIWTTVLMALFAILLAMLAVKLMKSR